jgi:hypothetical protein
VYIYRNICIYAHTHTHTQLPACNYIVCEQAAEKEHLRSGIKHDFGKVFTN